MNKKSVFLLIAMTVLCLMLTFGLTGCGMRHQEPEKEKQEETKPESNIIKDDETQYQADEQESINENAEDTDSDNPDTDQSDYSDSDNSDEEEDGDQSVYFMELESLGKKHESVEYLLSDVTGDGVVDLLVDCFPTEEGGSGHLYLIYTATNKSHDLEKLLETTGYGLETITCYNESESLVFYYAGHGHESYDYYRMEDGKYEYVASKGHQMTDDDNESDDTWVYWADSADLSESEFYDMTGGMEAGEAKVVDCVGWQKY